MYAPLLDYTSVAVIHSNGDVITVTLPGRIVLTGLTSAGGSVGPSDNGYVAYTSAGRTYLAVLNPDATIARTVALPEGATVRDPVVFGPDGAAYQLIQYLDAGGAVASQSVLALTTDTYTPTVPGGPLLQRTPSIQFGPDGTGYLVTNQNHFLGFNAAGGTVVTFDGPEFLVLRTIDFYDHEALVFAPDGTAYATFDGSDPGCTPSHRRAPPRFWISTRPRRWLFMRSSSAITTTRT